MKYFLNITCILSIISCENDNQFGYTGDSSALKNGITWTSKVRVTQNTAIKNCINLEFSVIDKNGLPKESLYIFKIKASNLQQQITLTKSTSPSDSIGALFTTSNDDVLGDIYEVDTLNQDNSITLTSLDLSKNRIEGRYTVNLILKRNSGLIGTPPKKIQFTNGSFISYIDPDWLK